jgi:hypothetical protein
MASEVPRVLRNRGQARLLCGIFSWWFLPYRYSHERPGPHGPVSHFRSRKGPRAVDIQGTIGANLPTSKANLLGRAILFNTEADYKIKGKSWPMLEQNSTFWSGGTLDGKKEVFLTPGLVIGSFPLAE